MNLSLETWLLIAILFLIMWEYVRYEPYDPTEGHEERQRKVWEYYTTLEPKSANYSSGIAPSSMQKLGDLDTHKHKTVTQFPSVPVMNPPRYIVSGNIPLNFDQPDSTPCKPKDRVSNYELNRLTPGGKIIQPPEKKMVFDDYDISVKETPRRTPTYHPVGVPPDMKLYPSTTQYNSKPLTPSTNPSLMTQLNNAKAILPYDSDIQSADNTIPPFNGVNRDIYVIGKARNLDAYFSLPLVDSIHRTKHFSTHNIVNSSILRDLSKVTYEGNPGYSYLQHIYGYLVPPVSGFYVFLIASDGDSAMYLGDAPNNKREIISMRATNTQTAYSDPLFLENSKIYWIEILNVMQVMNAKILSVQWKPKMNDGFIPLKSVYVYPNNPEFKRVTLIYDQIRYKMCYDDAINDLNNAWKSNQSFDDFERNIKYKKCGSPINYISP